MYRGFIVGVLILIGLSHTYKSDCGFIRQLLALLGSITAFDNDEGTALRTPPQKLHGHGQQRELGESKTLKLQD